VLICLFGASCDENYTSSDEAKNTTSSPVKSNDDRSSLESDTPSKEMEAHPEAATDDKNKKANGSELKLKEHTPQIQYHTTEFEEFRPLPPPKPTKKVPHAKILDLGFEKSRFEGEIYDVVTDLENRIIAVITRSKIFFLNKEGETKLERSFKRSRGYPSVVHSNDGGWIWDIFVVKRHYESVDVKTKVYDGDGKLCCTVKGGIDSLSPDGKKATVLGNMGMEYIEFGRKKTKLFGYSSSGTTQTCVFNDGIVLASSPGSSIVAAYDRSLDMRKSIRFGIHCRVVGCMSEIDRVFIGCADPRLKQSILLILNSKGEEIRRIWFPILGDNVFDYNGKKKAALAGVDRGEFLVVRPKDGKVLAHIKPVKGLSLEESAHPHDAYGKMLTHKAVLLDCAVALRKSIYGPSLSKKTHSLDVVDFSGRVLFHKRFRQSGEFPSFALWREGKNHVAYTKGNYTGRLVVECKKND
jgi:hypothetical protein